MNRCKKMGVFVCVFLAAVNVVACGQQKGDEVVTIDESFTKQQESSVQIDESTNSETEENKTISAQESNTQTENIDTEMTASGLSTYPLREEKSFSQKAFSIYTDIRKLQDKAKTSYTLSTRRSWFGYELFFASKNS